MGIGAAIGVGASGAGLGAAVGGPVGAAVGGLAGLLIGALAGGGDAGGASSAAAPAESSGAPGSIDPVESQGVPFAGGPSGGGPLPAYVAGGDMNTSPQQPTGVQPAGGQAAFSNSAAAGAAALRNLSAARGGFQPTARVAKVPSPFGGRKVGTPVPMTGTSLFDAIGQAYGMKPSTRSLTSAPTAYTPDAARTAPPPVEAMESHALGVAAAASRISTPVPQNSGSTTAGNALRDAVAKSYGARVPPSTRAGALSQVTAGASERPRTNAGPVETHAPPPGALNTSGVPAEAISQVQASSQEVVSKTRDRFQNLRGTGQSNVRFKLPK